MKLIRSSVVVFGLLLPIAAFAQGQAPRRLTLNDVVNLAGERAIDLRIAEKGVTAQEERAEGAFAQMFPRLRAEGNVFVWNEALSFSLAQGMMLPPGAEAPELVVRDQVTAQASLTLAQPITGLFALIRLYDLENVGLEVATFERDRSRLDATQRAVEAFLRSLQARAVLEVTEKSLAQVEAHRERARVLEQAGVLGAVDLLRLDAAHAAAQQAVLQSRTGRVLADRAVALSLDLPQDTPLEPVDDLPATPPKVELTKEAAHRRALERRPEIFTAQKRAEQAKFGREIAIAQFLPSVVAVATYMHTEGQSTFQPRDAAFAGATLTWDVFEWGRTLDLLQEANARAEQAELGAEAVAQQVAFDVERRTLEAQTAFESLSVLRTGLAAAEEAHRLQSVRYSQGEATTTDVLDAETELAKARTGYATARYDYYLAVANLARAIGRVPTGSPMEIHQP